MNKEFHERFNIPISTDEAKERFVNRVKNAIFHDFWESLPSDVKRKDKAVIYILGLPKNRSEFAPDWTEISYDFWLNVRAVQALYSVLSDQDGDRLSSYIESILDLSEIDLGIRWYQGQFIPSGSSLLDEKLVNDVLGCLQPEKYDGVRAPFIKGLAHLLHSIREGAPEIRTVC